MESVERIERLNWLQGSVGELPQTLAEQYGFNHFLLASQSCDVVNSDLNEVPRIAILPIYFDQDNGNFKYGKNPRKLVLTINDSHALVQIKDITYIPRELIADFPPKFQIDGHQCTIFSNWLGNVFNRSALPTEFNNRFSSSRDPQTKKAFRKFTDFLSRNDSFIYKVFIKLNDWAELQPDQIYTIDLVLVIRIESGDHVQRLNNEIDEILNELCDSQAGLEVANAEAVSTDNFTIQDMIEYKLWQFDYISLKAESQL